MRDLPTVLAASLVPLQEALADYGVEFRVLARRAGVDPDLAVQPNARAPSARLQKVWQLAARESGDPLFGLRVGARARPAMFHALAVALCRLLRVFAGDAARPSTIRLPHAAPDASFAAYHDVFGCLVAFDADRLVIEFDAQQAAAHVAGSNPDLAAEADRLAERYLAQVEPDSAAARVRALLLRAMPSGKIEQDSVARALRQSASTLQRRLREEGTTYQRLLDATRKNLALEFLREGRHSLADITFLLGFADQSNFTRAFRRWTGKTPRQFLC